MLCPGPQLLPLNFCQIRGPQILPTTSPSCCLASRPHTSLLVTTAPWPAGLAAPHPSPSPGVRECGAPGSLSAHTGARAGGPPAGTTCLQMSGVLALIPGPFARSAVSSDSGPRQVSSPHGSPLTQGLCRLHSLGPGGRGGHPEGGLSRGCGQAGGSVGASAQPCPHIPFRCLLGLGDLRFWSDRTLLQSAPLPARRCQPVSSCLAEWPWALQAAGGCLTQPLPALGLLVWTCSHCLLLSPVLCFFNLLLIDTF